MIPRFRIGSIPAAALALALLAPASAAPPSGAQTLEPVDTQPIVLFPVRLENGTYLDSYSAAFAPTAGNGYYSLRFEAPFHPTGPARLLGQRYDGHDLPVGEERTIGAGIQPGERSPYRLQVHRDGGPLLALWLASVHGSTITRGRFLHAQGAPLSPVFPIGSSSDADLLGVAFGKPHEALVVWRHPSGQARGRIVSSDGSRSPELFLADADTRGPVVAANSEGRYLLVWRGYEIGAFPDFVLWARWVEADGRLTGWPFVIAEGATGDPQIAMWPDGRSAVVWSSCTGSLPLTGCETRIRWLDAEGNPVGPPRTISPDDGRSHENPVMAVDSNGVLFVHWQVYPANPGTYPGDVFFHAVAFDAEGERLATAPVLEVKGEVVRRKLVVLEEDFFVSWYGFNADPTEGVFGMRYRFTPSDDGGEEPPPPPPDDPAPPAGAAPLTSPEVPGFRFWVRISTAGGAILGSMEPVCIPETVCVSGALAGRSEVFLRVVGPRPNGYLWPTIVKFTTSTVEVWIEQTATGEIRYYELEGASPGVDELPGLFDRTGFQP